MNFPIEHGDVSLPEGIKGDFSWLNLIFQQTKHQINEQGMGQKVHWGKSQFLVQLAIGWGSMSILKLQTHPSIVKYLLCLWHNIPLTSLHIRSKFVNIQSYFLMHVETTTTVAMCHVKNGRWTINIYQTQIFQVPWPSKYRSTSVNIRTEPSI